MSVSEAQVRGFLAGLERERDFFYFDEERIVSSEILVAHYVGEEVVGLCGIYRMQRLPTFFIAVRRAFQGKGVARKLMASLRDELELKKYRFTVLTVHRLNERAVTLYIGAGYRSLGMIGPVRYMVLPITGAGTLVYWGLRLAFPVIWALRVAKHRAWEKKRLKMEHAGE